MFLKHKRTLKTLKKLVNNVDFYQPCVESKSNHSCNRRVRVTLILDLGAIERDRRTTVPQCGPLWGGSHDAVN